MNFERFLTFLLIAGGVVLLVAGYVSDNKALKILGALPLVFILYVAYDIIVNRN